MPTKYSLTCHVDERWVKEWGKESSPVRFCFGIPMHEPYATVAAYASVVAGSITIEWEVDYYISASKTSFEAGTIISTVTNYVAIDFGQKYTIDQTWTDNPPSNSSQAPSNGFLFQNFTPATAVVAKQINGLKRPFYVSPVLLPPVGKRGGDTLIPGSIVAVWFQIDVENGMVIGPDTVQQFYVKMSDASAKVQYDYNGTWSMADDATDSLSNENGDGQGKTSDGS